MALTVEFISALGLTAGEWGKLQKTCKELSEIDREGIINDIIEMKLQQSNFDLTESQSLEYWKALSMVVDVNNRYTEYKVVKSHSEIEKLQETIRAQGETIHSLGKENQRIASSLEQAEDDKVKAEVHEKFHRRLNYFLAVTSVLLGVIGVALAFA